MRISVLVAVIAAIVCTASMAVADGATFQKWTFDTDATLAVPETVDNPYGTPEATINCDEVIATGYWEDGTGIFGTAQGFWDIGGGSIVLNVPNAGAAVPLDTEVLIKYWMDPSVAPIVELSGSASLIGTTTSLVEEDPIFGGWYEDRWTFRVASGTDLNALTIAGDPDFGVMIDEISVTTQAAAVPEPCSLLALGAGMAGLAFRRKRA